MLTFHDATRSPFVSHAAGLISRFCGVSLRPTRDIAEGADIYYGTDDRFPSRIRVPFCPGYDTRHIPGIPTREDYGLCVSPEAPFPFDLFAAMRFWLCDEGNAARPSECFDAHERLKALASAQQERDLFGVPIVNAYMDLFCAWISARTGTEFGPTVIPAGKKCVVVLSHDVDAPIGPADILHATRAFGRFMVQQPMRWIRHMKLYFRQQAQWVRRPLESFWIFDPVMRAEERLGIRSTFLFAAASRNGTPYANSEFDVTYSIAGADFKALFRRMVDMGFEIGLHTSYSARDSWQRIRDERECLSALTGSEIVANRHHYWHMTKPFWATLEDHARAGIAVDSSIGFNDAAGYRLGVAYPFQPWISEEGHATRTLQVPTVMMDSVFFREAGIPLSRKMDLVEAQLNTLKRYKGVASINWHDRTSYPGGKIFGAWGEMYLAVLSMIAADKEIATMPFREVMERTAAQGAVRGAALGEC